MTPALPASADPLIAKIKNLFSRDLAMQNDYLRQENKILRGKLGKRVPLDESERRLLVKYGMRIKEHLHEGKRQLNPIFTAFFIYGMVRPE